MPFTLRIAGAAAVAAMAVAAVAGVTSSTASGTPSSGNQLAGSWRSTVVRPAPLPALRSLISFTSDGVAIEMSNEAPTTRSPMFSSWERISGRTYAATGEHFISDPQTGQFLGTRRINRTIELSADGQSFTAIATVTTLGAGGNVLGTGTAIATAERMEVES